MSSPDFNPTAGQVSGADYIISDHIAAGDYLVGNVIDHFVDDYNPWVVGRDLVQGDYGDAHKTDLISLTGFAEDGVITELEMEVMLGINNGTAYTNDNAIGGRKLNTLQASIDLYNGGGTVNVANESLLEELNRQDLTNKDVDDLVNLLQEFEDNNQKITTLGNDTMAVVLAGDAEITPDNPESFSWYKLGRNVQNDSTKERYNVNMADNDGTINSHDQISWTMRTNEWGDDNLITNDTKLLAIEVNGKRVLINTKNWSTLTADRDDDYERSLIRKDNSNPIPPGPPEPPTEGPVDPDDPEDPTVDPENPENPSANYRTRH